MNVTLRPATAADAPRIADLLIDVRAAFMSYAPSAHADDDVRAWVASHLVPSGGVTVAMVDGATGRTVQGIMATEWSGGLGWIHQMAVDPARVGQGLGTVLLAHALRTLGRPIRLYTFQANAGARRFYERHGFAAIAFTEGHDNEEHCPDVLYELAGPVAPAGRPA
ncbi:GNAT family N-acetyltransferase [Ideonella sp. A 288]|uniref:GNAT family N-acetyltransferase n=1 Tax=Ideonella sp. A 288 TaxID=1962181 RepID=UPI000B4B8C8E|nr:GNAT family N-acetyltransferase [Ideonella sp. A 288]